jgi:hypothetical protein
MITSSTASGWEIMITWEPSISVTSAPARVLGLLDRTGQHAVLRSADQVDQLFALVRGEGGHVDETFDVRGGDAGVGDDRTTVGVAHGEDRTVDLIDRARHIGGVGGPATQRIDDREHPAHRPPPDVR